MKEGLAVALQLLWLVTFGCLVLAGWGIRQIFRSLVNLSAGILLVLTAPILVFLCVVGVLRRLAKGTRFEEIVEECRAAVEMSAEEKQWRKVAELIEEISKEGFERGEALTRSMRAGVGSQPRHRHQF